MKVSMGSLSILWGPPCCCVTLGALVLGWNKKVYAESREEMQGWAELSMVFLLQRSWRVSCRAGRTSAWPCTRSCTGGPSATRWPGGCCSKSERGFLQSCWKHGAKSLLGWEWPCLVAFVVIIGGYQEAFPEIALQSQTWWRSQGESGSGLELLLFQAEFSNTLMQ